MLTPDKIATLRRAACRWQDRRSDDPRAVVKFEGGSLEGIRLSVLQREALSPSLGFRTLRDSGPVPASSHRNVIAASVVSSTKPVALAPVTRRLFGVRSASQTVFPLCAHSATETRSGS